MRIHCDCSIIFWLFSIGKTNSITLYIKELKDEHSTTTIHINLTTAGSNFILIFCHSIVLVYPPTTPPSLSVPLSLNPGNNCYQRAEGEHGRWGQREDSHSIKLVGALQFIKWLSRPVKPFHGSALPNALQRPPDHHPPLGSSVALYSVYIALYDGNYYSAP